MTRLGSSAHEEVRIGMPFAARLFGILMVVAGAVLMLVVYVAEPSPDAATAPAGMALCG